MSLIESQMLNIQYYTWNFFVIVTILSLFLKRKKKQSHMRYLSN